MKPDVISIILIVLIPSDIDLFTLIQAKYVIFTSSTCCKNEINYIFDSDITHYPCERGQLTHDPCPFKIISLAAVQL